MKWYAWTSSRRGKQYVRPNGQLTKLISEAEVLKSREEAVAIAAWAGMNHGYKFHAGDLRAAVR